MVRGEERVTLKVYLFKPQFVELVARGEKRQTIRPKRKHPTKVGDELSLRTWEGKPYRSKQRILAAAICKETHEFKISVNPNPEGGVRFSFAVDGYPLHNPMRTELAKRDGFKDDVDMLNWFRKFHDLDHLNFEGELITW